MNRRWIRVVLVLVASLLAVAISPPERIQAQEDSDFTGDCTLTATGDFARVRSEWSLEGEEVARISNDDPRPYQVRGKNANAGYTWYLIFYGWVRADVVEVSGDDCADVPVVFTRVDMAFSSDEYPCPADFNAAGSFFLSPRVRSGAENVSVLDSGGIFYVYEAPSRESRPLAFVPAGDTLDNIGIGPLCDDGLVWWEVTYNGLTGFSYESWYATQQYYMAANGGAGSGGSVPPTGNTDGQPVTDAMAPGADELPPATTSNAPGVTYSTDELPARVLAFSPNGEIIAVFGGAFSASPDVQLWNLVTGDGAVVVPPQPVAALRWVDSSTIETVDIGGVLTRWSSNGQQSMEPITLVESTLPVDATFGAGRIAVSDCAEVDGAPDCSRSAIKVFANNGTLENTFTLDSLARGFALSSAGRLVATDGETVYQWDLETGEAVNQVPQSSLATINVLTISADGSAVALGGCGETATDENGLPGCVEGAVTIHAGDTLVQQAAISGLEGEVRGLRFAPSNTEIGITTATTAAVYSVSGGAAVRSYASGSDNNSGVAFAPDDGLIVVGDVNGLMYFWVR